MKWLTKFSISAIATKGTTVDTGKENFTLIMTAFR